MTTDDCRLLCEKMGRRWHIPVKINSNRMRVHYRCGVCKTRIRKGSAITFTTVQEREDVLRWAFGQEWWHDFILISSVSFHNEAAFFLDSAKHIKLLFRDPAHLPELVLQYGREVLGWEKGGQG